MLVERSVRLFHRGYRLSCSCPIFSGDCCCGLTCRRGDSAGDSVQGRLIRCRRSHSGKEPQSFQMLIKSLLYMLKSEYWKRYGESC